MSSEWIVGQAAFGLLVSHRVADNKVIWSTKVVDRMPRRTRVEEHIQRLTNGLVSKTSFLTDGETPLAVV